MTATSGRAYGEVAWSRAVGATTFEPYGAYSHVEYDADVSETGGDAALSGKVKQKADLLTAGFRTRTVLAGGEGRPRLSAVTHLAYTHDLNGDGPVFDAAFADWSAIPDRRRQSGRRRRLGRPGLQYPGDRAYGCRDGLQRPLQGRIPRQPHLWPVQRQVLIGAENAQDCRALGF